MTALHIIPAKDALCDFVRPCALAYTIAKDQLYAADARPLAWLAWSDLAITMTDEADQDEHRDPAHVEAAAYYLSTRGVE